MTGELLFEVVCRDLPSSETLCLKTSQSPTTATTQGVTKLLSIGCPIGKKLGLKAIGIHIETLPPGRRTSWPHAESSEEEFAYVLEGRPTSGLTEICMSSSPEICRVPAGTGIAHTFLNNSTETCRLLVGGEASKPENKIFYPLHPERNQVMAEKNLLWNDCPKRPLGAHDGLAKKP